MCVDLRVSIGVSSPGRLVASAGDYTALKFQPLLIRHLMIRRLLGLRRSRTSVMPVFDPDNPKETQKGWLLHAHKKRDMHDEEARRIQRWDVIIGTTAAVLSAGLLRRLWAR